MLSILHLRSFGYYPSLLNRWDGVSVCCEVLEKAKRSLTVFCMQDLVNDLFPKKFKSETLHRSGLRSVQQGFDSLQCRGENQSETVRAPEPAMVCFNSHPALRP